MWHFASALAEEGARVRYVRLDKAGNRQSPAGEVARAAAELRPAAVVVTERGEWRVLEDMPG